MNRHRIEHTQRERNKYRESESEEKTVKQDAEDREPKLT